MKTEKPLECPIIAGYPVNSINERGFGNVPTRVMDDVRLSIGARCLYSLLASHAGSQHEAWPGVKRIIATLGCSENSFYKYRQELSDLGYVTIETRNTRYGRRTVYVLEQIVPYSSCIDDDNGRELSTIPSSEPYLKICGMASEADCKDGGMWKNTGGKPSHTSKFEGSHTSKFEVQNNINGIKTKNSTTTPTESDSRLEQCGTAIAEPVVSSPTAPSSGVDLDVKKNEEATLVRDSIDERFYALEARSLRRTGSPARKEAARLTYRRLVNEGHSPDEIDAVYDHYLRWVESEKAQNPMGLPSFFEREDGWKLNYKQLMKEQAKAKSSTQTRAPEAGKQADLDYHRRSAAVKSTLPDSDAECAYLFAYADSSDDQHLHDVVAQIRSEKPVQYSNGYIDDRLSRRPSFPVLVRLVHSREHNRQYNETTYSALVAEGKIRG